MGVGPEQLSNIDKYIPSGTCDQAPSQGARLEHVIKLHAWDQGGAHDLALQQVARMEHMIKIHH